MTQFIWIVTTLPCLTEMIEKIDNNNGMTKLPSFRA